MSDWARDYFERGYAQRWGLPPVTDPVRRQVTGLRRLLDVLKVVNGAPILESFRATDREKRDGTLVAITRTLAHEPPQMTERIRVSGDRGTGEYERRQRLYRVDELQEALKRNGLSRTSVFATPEGTPFDPAHSPTMWILAQRNGAI